MAVPTLLPSTFMVLGVLLNRATLEGANFISDADAELLAESLPGLLHAEPGGRKLGSVEILRLRLK